MSEKQIESIGQRHTNRIFFQKNKDMDFYLYWMLSYVSEKGAEVGECYYAASQIDENKPESWVSAWMQLAEASEARAEIAHNKGHNISARETYLRAFTYYRAAVIYLRPSDERFHTLVKKFEICFKKSAALFEPYIEQVMIPFEGNELPGYFIKPENPRSKHPTLIMVGGGESFCEDLYFWAGASGARRGYNVLIVDLPGQGATPFVGLSLQANSEAPVSVIIDYLFTRPDVDSEKIAIHGLSGGGYFVTRAAAFEHRIQACIANSPITDLYRIVAAEMPAFLKNLPAFASDTTLAIAGWQNPSLAITLEKICWQAGVDKLSSFLEKSKTLNLDGLIEQISCPTLSLAGDGEGETSEPTRQLHDFNDRLKVHSKSITFFKNEDGANSHCQVGNFSLSQQVAYDWLDEVFA